MTTSNDPPFFETALQSTLSLFYFLLSLSGSLEDNYSTYKNLVDILNCIR